MAPMFLMLLAAVLHLPWPPGQAAERHGQQAIAGSCSQRLVTPITAKDVMILEA